MADLVNKRILALGHSHLGALLRAVEERGPGPVDVAFLELPDPKYQPNIASHFDQSGALSRLRRIFGRNAKMGARRLNPSIGREFKRLLRRRRPDLIVSCAMGNEYNIIAMLNHPRRFDFYLPGRPDLPTDETAEVLPVDLVEDLINFRLGKKLSMYLDLIAERGGDIPKIHIPPPPPIRSADHIRSYPGHFADRVEKFGISPPFFRLKTWLLTCKVQRKLCQARGIVPYGLPGSIFDTDGFLAERFWRVDPSHGNSDYGQAILDDVAQTDFAERAMELGRERAPIQKSAKSLLLAPHA
jgi:hypothetical protein